MGSSLHWNFFKLLICLTSVCNQICNLFFQHEDFRIFFPVWKTRKNSIKYKPLKSKKCEVPFVWPLSIYTLTVLTNLVQRVHVRARNRVQFYNVEITQSFFLCFPMAYGLLQHPSLAVNEWMKGKFCRAPPRSKMSTKSKVSCVTTILQFHFLGSFLSTWVLLGEGGCCSWMWFFPNRKIPCVIIEN